jgi:hypothetical protein
MVNFVILINKDFLLLVAEFFFFFFFNIKMYRIIVDLNVYHIFHNIY